LNIIPQLNQFISPIDTLYNDPANARTGHDIDAIAASLKKYGQRTPIIANQDGCILKGNGTYKAAKNLGWEQIAVITVDDDQLTAAGYSIADNRTGDMSHFDNDVLDKILSSMSDPLEIPGIDQAFLDSLSINLDEDEDDEKKNGKTDKYTHNIKSPIYEPTRPDKPAIKELYDDSYTNQLLKEIDESELPEDEKLFLRIAAYRHAIINYETVAEYYAHSLNETQAHFEKSALVIIDFDRALDLGFVKMTGEFADTFLPEAEE